MINCKFNDISFWKWKKITWSKIPEVNVKCNRTQHVEDFLPPVRSDSNSPSPYLDAILSCSLQIEDESKFDSLLVFFNSIYIASALHTFLFFLPLWLYIYEYILSSTHLVYLQALQFNWIKPRTNYFIIFSSSDPMAAVAPAVDAEYLKEIELTRADLRSVISSMNIAPLMLRLAYVLSDLLSKIRSWAASQSAFELEIWNLKSKQKI